MAGGREWLDAFYATLENRPIPVSSAIWLLEEKFGGVSQARIDAEVGRLRFSSQD